MGKFDGVLFVSDYDDTLFSHNLHLIPEANRTAISRFMEQGGRFTIATGRARATFQPQILRESLAFNAPVILSNGSAIYDFHAGKPVYQSFLPACAVEHMAELTAAFPDIAFEAYHNENIYVYGSNPVTKAHLARVAVPFTPRASVGGIPTPWTKLILEQDHPLLLEVQKFFLERWGELYEAIFSNLYLLEITAKGNTKGALVKMLAEHLGIAPEHTYCIGDNQNDLSMIQASALPFAPENCAPQVREFVGQTLCHCDQGAVAEAIAILEERYPK